MPQPPRLKQRQMHRQNKNFTPNWALWGIVGGVPAAFLGVFFFFPLWTILERTFTASEIAEVWSRNLDVLWFTAWQAAVSCVLTIAAAFPMAYVLGRYSFKGRNLVRAMLLVPFVLPTVVVSAAMLSVFDRFGVEDRLRHTLWAVLLAHVFFNFAIVARTLGSYWSHLGHAQEEAARTLGAGALRTFWSITLPRLMPALLGVASIVYLFCFTSFGVILILGGPRRATLDTEIWRYAIGRLEFSTAAALVVLQLLAVLAIVALNSWLTSRRVLPEQLRTDTSRRPETSRQRWAIRGTLAWAGLLLGVPLVTLVERSFGTGGDGYSLSSYRALASSGSAGRLLFVKPVEALINSLAFAGVATGIAVIVGVLVALAVAYSGGYSKGAAGAIDTAMLLPLGTSAVAVGLGLLLALDSPPLDIRDSPWIIPVAHALIGVPFVLRGVAPVLSAIPKQVRESAKLLGASQFRLWRDIDIPLAKRSILSAAGFAFAVSLGEFGASEFLVRPERPTVPVVIYQLLSRPGDLAYGQALALSVILMAVITAVVVAVEYQKAPRTAYDL